MTTKGRSKKEKSTVTGYENRIVAFIDLLGFKEIIMDTVVGKNMDNTENIGKVHELLLAMRRSLDIDEGYNEFIKSKQVTQFSDSVVISFLHDEESAVFWTLFEIQCLIVEIVSKGFLCRGGLTSGKLIHTNKLLFGPAFIDAYLMESKKAIFPRIIVDPEVIETAINYRHEDHTPEHIRESIMDMLTKDFDDFYYIDYFEKALECLNDTSCDTPTYMDNIKQIIKRNIKNKDPKIRKKYRWVREKYNETIKPYRKKAFLESLNDSDLYDFYKRLKKI